VDSNLELPQGLVLYKFFCRFILIEKGEKVSNAVQEGLSGCISCLDKFGVLGINL